MAVLGLLIAVLLITNALMLYSFTTASSSSGSSSAFSSHTVMVASLPGLRLSEEQLRHERHFTGHLPIDGRSHSSLFYYLVKARPHERGDEPPLVVWFNGGPGCASTVALVQEHGPFLLRPSSPASNHSLPFELLYNPYSWSNYAHMLYIDQPVDTGYSYRSPSTPEPSSEGELAEQLYTALSYFFNHHHPELRSSRLSLSGESYAARYIPSLAVFIMTKNGCQRRAARASPSRWLQAAVRDEEAASVDTDSLLYRRHEATFRSLNLSVRCNESSSHAPIMHLHSLLIGNGFYSAIIQRFAFRPLALALGFIDVQQANQYAGMEARCMAALRKAMYTQADASLLAQAQTKCSEMQEMILAMTAQVDMLDIRLYVQPFNKTLFTDFLNHPQVRAALAVPARVPKRQSDCNEKVRQALKADSMRSVSGLLGFLLHFLPTTVFAGNFDIKDGAWANEVLLDSLWDWEDRHDWFMSRRRVWRALPGLLSSGQEEQALQLQRGQVSPEIAVGRRTDVYGYSKSFGKLSFVVVSQAGHMVAASQPEKAADLFYRFTRDLPYHNAVTAADRRKNRQDASDVCELLQCDHAGHGYCDLTSALCRCEDNWAGVTCAVPVHHMTDILFEWQRSSRTRLQSFHHRSEVPPLGTVMYYFQVSEDSLSELRLNSALDITRHFSTFRHEVLNSAAASCTFSPPLRLSVKVEEFGSTGATNDSDGSDSASLSLSVLWGSAFHNKDPQQAIRFLADFDSANVFFGRSSGTDTQWIAPKLLAHLSDTSTRHDLHVYIQHCDHFAVKVENDAGAVNDVEYRIAINVELPSAASELAVWEQGAVPDRDSPGEIEYQAVFATVETGISGELWSTRLLAGCSLACNALLCIALTACMWRRQMGTREETTPLLRCQS